MQAAFGLVTSNLGKWVLSPQMRERLLGLVEGEIDEMEELTKLDLDA